MVVVKTLQHYKIHSIVPLAGHVQWSIDNQVAVINHKGVVIFELTGDPNTDSVRKFCINRTFLSVQKEISSIDTGFSEEDIFTHHYKKDLYDLILDRICTPKAFAGIDFNNHFTHLQWSPRVINSVYPYLKPKCLLAGLTSNFQLKIYDSKSRHKTEIISETPVVRNKDDVNEVDEEGGEGENTYSDDWTPVLDMAKIYNEIMYNEWTTPGQNLSFSHEIYKQRMYELAFCGFVWMSVNEESGDNTENETPVPTSVLITFQCNGDILIWNIFLNKQEQLFHPELVFKKNLFGTDIVSTSKCIYISPVLDLLVVGFKSGGIRMFLIEKVFEAASVEGSHTYVIEKEVSLYESDELKIEFLDSMGQPVPASDEIPPLCNFFLIVVKHPNIIMTFKIQVSSSLTSRSMQYEEVHHIQSPEGLIVGISRYSVDTFMVDHENGQLSFLKVDNGQIHFHKVERMNEESSNEDMDENTVNNNTIELDDDNLFEEKDLWIHKGFTLSPNSTMACFNKILSKTHDTILVKEPSECTFVAVLPNEDVWTQVKRKYAENNYSLQKILDVLHVLRYQMRLSVQDPMKYLDNKQLEDLTMEEAKLYLWVLKSMGLPKSWKFLKKNFIPNESLNRMKLNIVKQIALTEEIVMEKFLTIAVDRAYRSGFLSSSAKSKDIQCACIMLQYLMSKPSPQLSRDIVTTLVKTVDYDNVQPICPECGDKMSFGNNINYLPHQKQTKPGIPGYRWKGQTCKSQHDIPVCVLSLIPFDYPNRTCPFCGCASLMEPAFNQKTICPFCEEFLVFEPVLDLELENFQNQLLPPPTDSSDSVNETMDDNDDDQDC